MICKRVDGELFRCAECGSSVVMRAEPGRTYEFRRGDVRLIPDDFPLATCVSCGERFSTVGEAEAFERLFSTEAPPMRYRTKRALLRPLYAAHRRLAERLFYGRPLGRAGRAALGAVRWLLDRLE